MGKLIIDGIEVGGSSSASSVKYNNTNSTLVSTNVQGAITELNESLNELNSNLGGFTPVIDEEGKITGYTTTIGGADTVFPFSSLCKSVYDGKEGSASNTATIANLEIGKTYIVSLIHATTSNSMQLKSGATQLWCKSVYLPCHTGAYITTFMIVPTSTSVVFGHTSTGGLSYIYAKIEN